MASSLPPSIKESSTAPSLPISADTEDVYEQHQESIVVDTSRRVAEKENPSYTVSTDDDKQHSSIASTSTYNGRKESGMTAGGLDREGPDVKNAFRGSTSQKLYSSAYSQNSADIEEKVQKTPPPLRKSYRNERTEKPGNEPKKDGDNSDTSNTSYKQQNMPKQYEQLPHDGSINEILKLKLSHLDCTNKKQGSDGVWFAANSLTPWLSFTNTGVVTVSATFSQVRNPRLLALRPLLPTSLAILNGDLISFALLLISLKQTKGLGGKKKMKCLLCPLLETAEA
ncbi:Kinesin-like protein [Forsythia ovata]|uniref:Kinesin-like protein n=1 Tax=Forsythia ovata TaxID=205694 RepID=A0ABD1WIP6_9LAMI